MTPDIKKIKITHAFNSYFPHVAELNITVIASSSEPTPPPSPTPTPTPTPPSGGGGYTDGGSGGSGGGRGSVGLGPVQVELKTLVLNTVKSIKGVLNTDAGVWNYDVVNDKWKFAAANQVGQYVNAVDGFYILVRNKSIIENNVTTNVPVSYTYYFDNTGNMFFGYIKTIDNKTYFFENERNKDEGAMVVGWKKYKISGIISMLMEKCLLIQLHQMAM